MRFGYLRTVTVGSQQSAVGILRQHKSHGIAEDISGDFSLMAHAFIKKISRIFSQTLAYCLFQGTFINLSADSQNKYLDRRLTFWCTFFIERLDACTLLQVDLGNLAGRLGWAIRLDDYVGRLSCEIHLGDSLTKPMKRSSKLPKSDHFGREMFGNQDDTWLWL